MSQAKRLEILQLDLDGSKQAAQRLTAELEAKDRSLNQHRTDHELEQSRAAKLEQSLSNMEKLQVDVNKSREQNQKLRDENTRANLEAKDSLLHQYQADLEHRKAQVEELEKKVMDLKISESSLKESVSACLIHGLGVWLSRFWKRSSSNGTEYVELHVV
ncbi:hypothetical protein BGZ63DRAFT_395079 [Mariannaea sp. PMI_226]|nr:hypothetical protein BGZ63DRAFT_395079 [Mariannaea sp. PMI_226]